MELSISRKKVIDINFDDRVVFCDKTRQSNVNNFFSIRGRKLHDSSL